MDLIRTDTVFGKRANIVGNISADLVLESLGKIYIKSRNSARTLEDVIKSIATTDVESAAAKTIIVDGLENLDVEPKEGQFIYDKLSNILYLWLDGKAVELINVAPEGTGYVKRSGDTMTGRLSINVPNGPPLAVNSSELVENLNAEYLDGEPKSAFALKRKDELISGRWTFRNITKFQSNTKFNQDIIVDGNVGTPDFASGFAGFGWRLEADTNTLTVDNLIVRKLMMVYELVVNRVSAVNGSLWVTNAGKVTSASKLQTFNYDFIVNGGSALTLSDFLKTLEDNIYFIYYPNVSYRYITPEERMTPSGIVSSESIKTLSGEARSQALVIRVIDVEAFRLEIASYLNNPVTYFESKSEAFRAYNLFSEDFYYEVVFPMVNNKNYDAFLVSELYKSEQEANAKLLNPNPDNYLNLAKAYVEGKYPGLWTSNTWLSVADIVTNVKSYYKYFATGPYFVATFDDESLPVFREGDILRCQKWMHGGVKYYDAVICNYISDSTYFIQLADSIFDTYTEIHYDDKLLANVKSISGEEQINTTLYKLSREYIPPEEDREIMNRDGTYRVVTTEEQWKELLLAGVTEKDNLVLFGNLWNWQRQNALYLTSVDEHSPYMDVITNVNRPDFSVIYKAPIYKTEKLYKSLAIRLPGYPNDPIPYTMDYYLQTSSLKAKYAYGKAQGAHLFFDLSKHTVPASVEDVRYLSDIPNENCIFESGESPYILLAEDETELLLEDGCSSLRMESGQSQTVIQTHRTTKVRVGQLEGITDERFSITKQPYGYGLYADNVFLTGEFILSNGKTVFEISEEGMRFAVASKYAGDNARELLRKDMEAADKRLAEVDAAMQLAHNQLRTEHNQLQADHNLLRIDHNILDAEHDALVARVVATEGDLRDFHESVYTIDDLKTAGFVISNKNNYPGMIIWANYIYFATKLAELDGDEAPTALFSEGRINAKFLEVQDIHSGYFLYPENDSSHVHYYYNLSEVYQSGGNWYYVNNKKFATSNGKQVYELRDDYAWHLKYRGDGYLAFGNIAWTRDGNVSLHGNVSVSGSLGIYIDGGTNGSSSLGLTLNGELFTGAVAFALYNAGKRIRTYDCVGEMSAKSGQIIASVGCSLPLGYTITASMPSNVSVDLYYGTAYRTTLNNGSSITLNTYSKVNRFEVEAKETTTYRNVTVSFTIDGVGSELGPDHIYISGSIDGLHTLWMGEDGFSVLCSGNRVLHSASAAKDSLNRVMNGTYGLQIDDTGIYLIKNTSTDTNFMGNSGYYLGYSNLFTYRKSIFDWFVTRDEWTGGSSSSSSGSKIYYIIDNSTNIDGVSLSGSTINLENIYSKVNSGDIIMVKGIGLYLGFSTSSSHPIYTDTGSGTTETISADKLSRIFMRISGGWVEYFCV